MEIKKEYYAKFNYPGYENLKIYLGECTKPIQILFKKSDKTHEAMLKVLSAKAKKKRMNISSLIRIALEDKYKKRGRQLLVLLTAKKEKLRVNKSMAKVVREFIEKQIIGGGK